MGDNHYLEDVSVNSIKPKSFTLSLALGIHSIVILNIT